MQFKEGDEVRWACSDGHGLGVVQSVFDEKTTPKIKGTEVMRNGTKDDPAIYFKQEDGDAVVKLASKIKKK